MPDITPELADLYGLRSATEGGGFFCGVEYQEYAIGGVTYRWQPGVKLAWGIAFSRLGVLSDMDCKDAITAALKEISDACDVKHEFISNADRANIKIISTRLDGASGVLADCQLPVGNVTVEGTQLLMRIDDSETWGLFANPPAGKIDFYRVVLHELLHAHGLGHKPANVNEPALIAPMYSTQIRSLQKADKGELVRRYGAAKTIPTPTTPAAPAGKCEIESLVIKTPDGKRYSAKGVANPLALTEE